jgi:hypothetical protein
MQKAVSVCDIYFNGSDVVKSCSADDFHIPYWEEEYQSDSDYFSVKRKSREKADELNYRIKELKKREANHKYTGRSIWEKRGIIRHLVRTSNELESSKSRVLHFIKTGRPYAVLSAYQSALPDSENMKLYDEFKAEVKQLKRVYIELRAGSNYYQLKFKYFLMIPGLTLKEAQELGRKYSRKLFLFVNDKKAGIYRSSTGACMQLAGLPLGRKDFLEAYKLLIKVDAENAMNISFLEEKIIPSRTDAYRAMGTGKLPCAEWRNLTDTNCLTA